MHTNLNSMRQISVVLFVISSFSMYAGLEKKSSACEEPCPNKKQTSIPKNVSPKQKKAMPDVDPKPSLPGVKELKESLKLKILNEQSISGRLDKLKSITSREIQKQDTTITEFTNSNFKTYKVDNSTLPIPSKADNNKFNLDLNDKLKIKE